MLLTMPTDYHSLLVTGENGEGVLVLINRVKVLPPINCRAGRGSNTNQTLYENDSGMERENKLRPPPPIIPDLVFLLVVSLALAQHIYTCV